MWLFRRKSTHRSRAGREADLVVFPELNVREDDPHAELLEMAVHDIDNFQHVLASLMLRVELVVLKYFNFNNDPFIIHQLFFIIYSPFSSP